jgi:uncharacterized protein YndB with AHSA1/START domain
MNEEDFGIPIAPDAVRFERLLPGPIERVWAYLVEPEKRKRWFAGGPMELRPGGKAELMFKHSELNDNPEPTPEKYKAIENGHPAPGTILEVDPPRLLRYAWHDETYDTEVTFELIPEGDKVRLRLTHSKLASIDERTNVSGGWHALLAMLEDELEGRVRRPFWTFQEKVSAEYARRAE